MPKGDEVKIGGFDRAVVEGDTDAIGANRGRVIDVPGHTAGHIAYHFAGAGEGGEDVLFSGDTIFAMGCGKPVRRDSAEAHAPTALNEDRRPAPRKRPSSTAPTNTPKPTARFALTAEPENAALQERRQAEVMEMRSPRRNPPCQRRSKEELATNPFVRAGSAEELGRRRAAKDAF